MVPSLLLFLSFFFAKVSAWEDLHNVPGAFVGIWDKSTQVCLCIPNHNTPNLDPPSPSPNATIEPPPPILSLELRPSLVPYPSDEDEPSPTDESKPTLSVEPSSSPPVVEDEPKPTLNVEPSAAAEIPSTTDVVDPSSVPYVTDVTEPTTEPETSSPPSAPDGFDATDTPSPSSLSQPFPSVEPSVPTEIDSSYPPSLTIAVEPSKPTETEAMDGEVSVSTNPTSFGHKPMLVNETPIESALPTPEEPSPGVFEVPCPSQYTPVCCVTAGIWKTVSNACSCEKDGFVLYTGECEPLLLSCPELLAPVCCKSGDGIKTVDNDCFCERTGLVLYSGECSITAEESEPPLPLITSEVSPSAEVPDADATPAIEPSETPEQSTPFLPDTVEPSPSIVKTNLPGISETPPVVFSAEPSEAFEPFVSETPEPTVERGITESIPPESTESAEPSSSEIDSSILPELNEITPVPTTEEESFAPVPPQPTEAAVTASPSAESTIPPETTVKKPTITPTPGNGDMLVKLSTMTPMVSKRPPKPCYYKLWMYKVLVLEKKGEKRRLLAISCIDGEFRYCEFSQHKKIVSGKEVKITENGNCLSECETDKIDSYFKMALVKQYYVGGKSTGWIVKPAASPGM